MPKELKRVPVTSSNIVSVGYDENQALLQVEFKSGKGNPNHVYNYTPVAKMQFDEMINAESIGKYFHNNIKVATGVKYEKVR